MNSSEFILTFAEDLEEISTVPAERSLFKLTARGIQSLNEAKEALDSRMKEIEKEGGTILTSPCASNIDTVSVTSDGFYDTVFKYKTPEGKEKSYGHWAVMVLKEAALDTEYLPLDIPWLTNYFETLFAEFYFEDRWSEEEFPILKRTLTFKGRPETVEVIWNAHCLEEESDYNKATGFKYTQIQISSENTPIKEFFVSQAEYSDWEKIIPLLLLTEFAQRYSDSLNL